MLKTISIVATWQIGTLKTSHRWAAIQIPSVPSVKSAVKFGRSGIFKPSTRQSRFRIIRRIRPSDLALAGATFYWKRASAHGTSLHFYASFPNLPPDPAIRRFQRYTPSTRHFNECCISFFSRCYGESRAALQATPNTSYPSLLIPALVVIGWFVTHLMTDLRDRGNRRRNLRTQYLIDVYRKLEEAARCRAINANTPQAAQLETAIADIQLFGTQKQIALARAFSQVFANAGGADLDELLASISNDLRTQLLLPRVSEPVIHLRIKPNE